MVPGERELETLPEWLTATARNELWFVDPPHHVPKSPDALNVGILSHFRYSFCMIALGSLAIYHRLNRERTCHAVADRVFAYDPILDAEGRIRPDLSLDSPLPTMERQIPLCDLDLICVSLTNPDAVTVALQLLMLGEVPVRAADRAEQSGPLVLAGGPGVCNPEPFANFFDLFCIGDGADLTAEIVRAMYELRRAGAPHRAGEILRFLNNPAGLYVPSEYMFSYAGSRVAGIRADNGAPSHVVPAVDLPHEGAQCSLVSDRETAVLVPNYGCKHRCSYCQISEIQYREFPVERLLERVRQYVDLGVQSLIVNSATLTQHGEIDQLLQGIARSIGGSAETIRVFIGSMRFDEVSPDVLAEMNSLGAFSHTYLLYTNGSTRRFMALAPEHGSRELMRRMQRPVDPWRVLQTIRLAMAEGVCNFVLYFIVGFESETAEDREMTAGLVAEVLDLIAPEDGMIIMKVNPLIPTPSTACQRFRMPSNSEYQEHIDEIVASVIRRVGSERFERQVNIVPLPPSRLRFESMVNRADRRIGPLIERVTQSRSAGIDPSADQLCAWLSELGLCWEDLACGRGPEEILPWQIVDRTIPSMERQIVLSIRERAGTAG